MTATLTKLYLKVGNHAWWILGEMVWPLQDDEPSDCCCSAERWAGKVSIVKVDVDSSQDTAGQYGIQSIPTFDGIC